VGRLGPLRWRSVGRLLTVWRPPRTSWTPLLHLRWCSSGSSLHRPGGVDLGRPCGYILSPWGGVAAPSCSVDPPVWVDGLSTIGGFIDSALEVGARSGRIWPINFTNGEVCGGPALRCRGRDCRCVRASGVAGWLRTVTRGWWHFELALGESLSGYGQPTVDAPVVVVPLVGGTTVEYPRPPSSDQSLRGGSFDPVGTGDMHRFTSLTYFRASPRRPRSHMHFLWVG
jgi:hypothetical protein